MLPETIEGGRFQLRPFRPEDFDDVYTYASDDEFLRYLPIAQPYTLACASEFLALAAAVDRKQRVFWAIEVGGRASGGINIRFVAEHRVAEIGYALARRAWGRGFATSAARLVVGAAFRTYSQLERVRASADPRNHASIRVMEKLGMRREGLLRSNRPCRGELTDEVVYGLLRHEWRVPSFEVRRAGVQDAEAIATAHRDSILSLGPQFYSDETVGDWAAGLSASMYTEAMRQGETFFVAVDGAGVTLGFSTHRNDDGTHGTAVYVRGYAARRGVGSALLRAAEAHARGAGAKAVDIEASLLAVEFYKSLGFEEVGRGEHALGSGRSMACVFMRKRL
jgi:RimJ/RimL family protein N-acetyltransferase/ribosomal protein S18 acetylase RimI-like enzyme